MLATRNMKSNKKRDELSGRRSGKGSADGRSGSAASRKGGESGAEDKGPSDENVVHKKKLKKNVVSKDAWTQTERSDYMLIKQRQKQKEIIQLAKQGMLPPGVNPQALVQSFIQMQPGSQQMLQMQQQAAAQAKAQAPGDKAASTSNSYRQQIVVGNA